MVNESDVIGYRYTVTKQHMAKIFLIVNPFGWSYHDKNVNILKSQECQHSNEGKKNFKKDPPTSWVRVFDFLNHISFELK